MENGVKKTRVNFDGKHSLDVFINESNKTVVAELLEADEMPAFIYAEKFDAPCNYLRAAIKKGIAYLNGNTPDLHKAGCKSDGKYSVFLNKQIDMI